MVDSVFTKRYQKLTRILADARRAKRLSQAELARHIGKIQTFVSKYERGERRIDVIEFIDIAKVLGIDPGKVVRQLQSMDDQ